MNKKLLFATMSLAALTACTNDDFESQKVAEETSPIKFEILNNNDAFTRAYMDGNTIKWQATEGDLFTLYHGATAGGFTTGYENATYQAKMDGEGAATLTTPSMIKQGKAIMVWPVDTTFRIKPTDALTIKIPTIQGGKVDDKDLLAYQIPYVSDLIDIEANADYSETAPAGIIPTAYKTAGYDRKYQVYMRPMASQLIVKADYAGTDATLAELYSGDDPIEEIKVTSIDLQTAAATAFTTQVPVKFTAPTPAINTQWDLVANNRKWVQVTDFDLSAAAMTANGTKANKLTTKSLTGNESAKFLILPQDPIGDTAGDQVASGAVVVNTIYGKVVVADPTDDATSQYTAAEAADAWYRFVSSSTAAHHADETVAPTAGADGKFKTTSKPATGLAQTLDGFSAFKATAASPIIKDEPVGAFATRYVKVLLTHLDMSDLHVKSNDQLRAVARVWKKMSLPAVTVILDGDAEGKFEISQKTIETINTINGATTNFKVMPCTVVGEACTKIVVIGSDYKQAIQDMKFIVDNAGTKAAVAFANEGTTTPWEWNTASAITIGNGAATISKVINEGALKVTVGNIELTNAWDIENAEGATMNITQVTTVKSNLTNYGTINVGDANHTNAELRAYGKVITNEAKSLTRQGIINNHGVVGVTAGTATPGTFNNYGTINMMNADAITLLTSNETGPLAGGLADFAAEWDDGSNIAINKMGTVVLPNNNATAIVSISNATDAGFIKYNLTAPADGKLAYSTPAGNVKYNTIVVNQNIKEISFSAWGGNNEIQFIEFDGTRTQVVNSAAGNLPNLKGIIVNDSKSIIIEKGNVINCSDGAYLGTGATVYRGGTFNYQNTTTNYFGVWNETQIVEY